MYKNAEKYLADKGSLSRKKVRDVVTMSRIKRNIRKINTMICVIPPPSHDEVILPQKSEYVLHADDGDANNSQNNNGNNTGNRMLVSGSDRKLSKLSNSPSVTSSSIPPRPLDREQISVLMDKVQAAADDIPDWEKRFLDHAKRKKKGGRRALGYNTVAIRTSLERKLCAVIKQIHKEEGKKVVEEGVKKVHPELSARTLAPYYKMTDVKQFIEMFVRVDEDGSGELDQDEWVKFFTTLNRSMPVQQARMMFMECDTNNDGLLGLKELIPINFEKAREEQQKAIFAYIDAEINKKRVKKSQDCMTTYEMEQLFSCYDVAGLGFIAIWLIRDRIKMLPLPLNISIEALDTMKGLEDDEMINQGEFVRLFSAYTSN